MFRFVITFVFLISLFLAFNVNAYVCPIDFSPKYYFIKCDDAGCNEAITLNTPNDNCLDNDIFYSVLYFSEKEIQELLIKSQKSNFEIESGTYRISRSFISIPPREVSYFFLRLGDVDEFYSIIENLETEAFEKNIPIFIGYIIVFVVIIIFIIVFLLCVDRLLFFVFDFIKHCYTNKDPAVRFSFSRPITVKTIVLNLPIILILMFFTALFFLFLCSLQLFCF